MTCHFSYLKMLELEMITGYKNKKKVMDTNTIEIHMTIFNISLILQ